MPLPCLDVPIATGRTIMVEINWDEVSISAGLNMSKYLAVALLLPLLVACGAADAPTLAPTATPQPTPTPTAVPTATPLPAPTLTPEPTATPTVAVAPGPASEADEHDPSVLDAVFPEIREKMEDIRPVYTAYFHSEDWQTPGKNTTVDEVFKLLKMENIATHEGLQPVSPALVVDREPDLIIADSIESVVENPALAGLHMVQDTAHIPHHIFVLREGYSFYVADPGFRKTVKAFAAFAYPGTFAFEEEAVDDHSGGDEEAGKDHDGGVEEAGHDQGDGHSHGH